MQPILGPPSGLAGDDDAPDLVSPADRGDGSAWSRNAGCRPRSSSPTARRPWRASWLGPAPSRPWPRPPAERSPADGRPLDELELLAPSRGPARSSRSGGTTASTRPRRACEPPPAPLIFAKWPSSVVGPGAEIRWDPALTAQVDYEAELARGHRPHAPAGSSAADALDHVLGYTCLNDVSARDLQFGDGQWTRGKSLDTFCPMGPVARHGRRDPRSAGLDIACRVGDEVLQQANTAEMYFGVAEIISHCSQAFTPGARRRHRDRDARRRRHLPRSAAAARRRRRVTVEIERIGR